MNFFLPLNTLSQDRPLQTVSRRTALLGVAAGGTALGLAACSGQTQSVTSSGDDDNDTKTVSIGFVPFDEVIATSYLWKHILESQDYEVNMQQLEVATVYQGVADGKLDVFFGGCPITHQDYWDRFSTDFVEGNQWYDTLIQGVAVPDYTGLTKFSDLQGKAAEFNGQIIGIESGSGLMKQTTEDAPKVYDMTGYTVVDGSTAAMLAALDKATTDQTPIAVTLWQPHWAFERYPIVLLEDDKSAYPGNDTYHVVQSKTFTNTAVTGLWDKFHMTPDELNSLMLGITDAGAGNEDKAVEAWVKDNQTSVDGWAKA